MERKTESEERRMSRQERKREERIEKIRQEDPGFIPPERYDGPRKRTSPWIVIGVGVLVVLLLIWLTVAMFTGDTDVNMINLF